MCGRSSEATRPARHAFAIPRATCHDAARRARTATDHLLLAGQHEAESSAVRSLAEPLTHRRGGRQYHSDPATVRHLRCFRCAAAATEYELIDVDEAHDASVAPKREKIEAMRTPRRSRATGEVVAPFVPFDGWLTEVELSIAQGRHHQIRRLCKRAGLPLRHLRRVAVGPIELGSMAPGDVRLLTLDEKTALYTACLPRLEGAHARRERAMRVMRERARRRALRVRLRDGVEPARESA
mmetsp:Transcript_73233/g.194620  ORF Transcript_73233/g.194620 Transcript_73233/m.194620 type:complete len:239 (+) Transcript_73233:348-1064(+)